MRQRQARFVGEPCRKNFVPRSVIKTSREEITDLPLTVRKYTKNVQEDWELAAEGDTAELPSGLHGYTFIVGALFQSKDRPQEDGTQLYTGDGMIYRLDFENNKAILKTRITKTPCYYADIAITGASNSAIWRPKTTFSKQHWLWSAFAAFRNGGPSRFSILLGGRNQLNTAFLRVGDRLLVTIDAGRPYEVDPDTLELLAPVGFTKEWIGILPIVSKAVSKLTGSYPFDVYINSAHPVTDLKVSSNEFFTTNYSTGYNGLFQKQFNWLIDQLSKLFKNKADAKDQWGRFTDLIHYQFENNSKSQLSEQQKPLLKRWRLVLDDNLRKGQPVLVEQSLHQLAITEDFIILADIAFKMEFSQIFSPFTFGFLKLKFFDKFYSLGAWLYAKFLRSIPPLPKGILYIVKRSDISNYPECTANEPVKTLPAKQVILPYEISHFAANYSNSSGKITLHVGHNNGWDVTEWITRYDLSVSGKPCLRSDLEGMQTGTTDLGAVAKYVIDGNTGEIETIHVLRDTEFTWSPSIYTHSELCRDDINSQETEVKDIYWIAWGFTWELIPERLYNVYKLRGYRALPIGNLPEGYKPLSLLRVDTETMRIVDFFQFPAGYFVSSPQFIPSSQPLQEGSLSKHGFIVCTVLADNPENEEESCDEFWIFHADDFQNKPIYRLSAPPNHEPLNLALTLHTTWMSEIRSEQQQARYADRFVRQNIRRNSVYEDYKSRLEKANKRVVNLFKDVVYEYFACQIPEIEAEDRLQQKDYQINCSEIDS